MRIKYRFSELAEKTIDEFCKRALAGADLPACVECEITNQPILDATMDSIWCLIEIPGGSACLAFDIFQSAWLYPSQNPDARAPRVENLQASMNAWNEELQSDVEQTWNDKLGVWEIKTDSAR